MSASYGSNFEVSHVCKEGKGTVGGNVNDVFESVDDQVVRDARHKDHCFDVQGKLLLFSSLVYITKCINYIHCANLPS